MPVTVATDQATLDAAAAQVSLDVPRGGRRHSAGEPAQHMQDVNFPASRVKSFGYP